MSGQLVSTNTLLTVVRMKQYQNKHLLNFRSKAVSNLITLGIEHLEISKQIDGIDFIGVLTGASIGNWGVLLALTLSADASSSGMLCVTTSFLFLLFI